MAISSALVTRDTHRIESVAARLDVSIKTINRMIDRGVLRTVRPLGAGRGRLVLVTEQSIQDFLASATRERGDA